MQRAIVRPARTRIAALRRARTCYDHLAGRLGVAVLDDLVEHGALVPTDGTGAGTAPPAQYRLGPRAEEVFGRLGVDLGALTARPRSARPLLRFCVDGTERRPHLAGALGAAVLARAEQAGWVVRRADCRAVDVTDAGRRALGDAARSGGARYDNL